MFNIKGKHAVITGGASGIGLSTAQRFIKCGANVTIADLGDNDGVADKLGAFFVKTDVSDEKSVIELFDNASNEFGNIDIIFNNAGISPPFCSMEDTPLSDFDKAYKVNVIGVRNGIVHGSKFMNDGGSIINTASLASKMGVFGLSSYAASKHAVIALTKTAALELGERNIRVNAICPSSVKTPMAEQGDQLQIEIEKVLIPQSRICEPEEVAALVHFLASSDCTFLNGQCINLDGGMTAGLGPDIWETIEKSFQ